MCLTKPTSSQPFLELPSSRAIDNIRSKMAGARAMSMVTARRRIFEISFDEYVGTLNGIFNVLEVGGGLVVYMVGGGPQETGPQRCLTGTAFTYWFNGLFMILSSFLSAASAQILPLRMVIRPPSYS
ncbi:uncharacterized protein LOC144149685 [Haemaphysalis longicornis]